jgi:hypothetical protein
LTRGSLSPAPPLTELKKVLRLRFSTPSATPVVLLNDRMKTLAATMTCVGPTAPCESGGTNPPASGDAMPRKLLLTVCGVLRIGSAAFVSDDS